MIAKLFPAGGIPDPTPVPPPGAELISDVLNWIFWFVIAIGIVGLLASVGLVFFGVIDGRSSQGFKSFFIVCLAIILAGAVGQIVRTLL